MITLHQYPLCPHSRFVRLVLAEMGLEADFVEERPWERRRPFLELNPAGTLPVLVEEDGLAVPGAGVIAEYLDETRGAGLGGPTAACRSGSTERIEVRRLLDWFLVKFDEEVTGYLVTEKVYKRFMTAENGGGSPDMSGDPGRAQQCALSSDLYRLPDREAKLAGRRRADLCGSRGGGPSLRGGLSRRRAMGTRTKRRRLWYARVKSRPSFRALLADRVPGMAPSVHYEQSRLLSGDELKRAVASAGAALGSSSCASRRPDAIPLAPDRLDAWLAAGHHGSMDWMAEARRTARRSAGAVAAGAQHRHARPELRPRWRPAAHPRPQGPRDDLGLCPQPRLSRRHQGQAEGSSPASSPRGAGRT